MQPRDRTDVEKLQQQPIDLVTEDGKPFEVPFEGSLGLLALGYLGLAAWRQKRQQVSQETHVKDPDGS